MEVAAIKCGKKLTYTWTQKGIKHANEGAICL